MKHIYPPAHAPAVHYQHQHPPGRFIIISMAVLSTVALAGATALTLWLFS